MLTNCTQRWRDGRARYRPPREPIDPRRFEVAPIKGDGSDTIAKAFVEAHHYARGYPSAKYRYGLYEGEQLVGVAVFSTPANPLALSVIPSDRDARFELGRFVLLDRVPANGETWFLGRCFEQLRDEGVAGVVSFSDPVPRTDEDGVVTFAGHVGTIYQAHNATYLGRSKRETKLLLPDGRVICGRTLTKIRKRERGVEYSGRILTDYGATPLTSNEDPRAWVKRWTALLTRPFVHGGNHKYAWMLRGRDRRFLPDSLPYPKMHVPDLGPLFS